MNEPTVIDIEQICRVCRIFSDCGYRYHQCVSECRRIKEAAQATA